MSDKKNIGVVEYFNANSTSFYCGFAKIKFTSQFDYIKSRGKSFRAFIKNPCKINFQKGEIICFDLSENVTKNNCLLEVENIRRAEVQDLLNEKFLAEEKDFLQIRKALVDVSNYSLREEFLNILIESEKYFSTSWVNEYLAKNAKPEIYTQKFLQMYQKNPEKFCGFNSVEGFNEHIYNCILRAHDDEVTLRFWKEFVLTVHENFSSEIFSALWKEFDTQQKFFLLQRAMKNFSDEDCENLFEKFIKDNYEFIFHGKIDDEIEFARRFSHCIKKSIYEVQCAKFLLNNLELFKIVDVGDDITLFFLYTLAKNDAEFELMDKVCKIFRHFKNVDTMSPKIHEAFLIFEAGCLKMANKSPRENIKKVEQIFLNNFMLDSENPEKFPDFKHIFPTCGKTRKVGENQEVKILFCEARKWFKPECKVVNKDNVQAYYSQQPEFEEVGYNYRAYHSGKPEWIESCAETKQQVEMVEVNYCPPQRGYDKDCAHVDAKFDLPVEKWTIIELAEKFNLTEDVKEVLSYRINIKSVGECFNYIGAAYNRLFELREHLKCRECGEYMKPVNPPKFKAVSNLEELIYKAHHAIFGATVFQCENKSENRTCSNYEKQVYLSHCWHCHSLIDSRDNHVTLANPHPVKPLEPEANREYKFYSCKVCGAGYQDSTSPNSKPFILWGEKGERHAVFPGTLCPHCLKCDNCGSQDFEIIPDQEKKVCHLRCKSCRKEMIAPLTFEDKTTSEKAITRKYVCKKCRHKIEFNRNDLKYFAENYHYKDIDWARW